MDDHQEGIRQRKKRASKIALIFIAKLFVSYFLLSECHKFLYSATNPTGRFYMPFFAEHLDYIQGLRNILIIPAGWLIKTFGYDVRHNATELMVIGGPVLRVNYDCLGLNVMSFLIAFTFAFPSRVADKLRLLGGTILTVYILNVIRIAGLALLLTWIPDQQNYFSYHHEIFNIIVYLVIFVILYLWIKKHPLKLPTP